MDMICADFGKKNKAIPFYIQNKNTKKERLFIFCFLSFFATGFSQAEAIIAPVSVFIWPSIFPMDSAIYFCAQYIVSYPKEYHVGEYEKRETCCCHQTLYRLLEREIQSHTPQVYRDDEYYRTVYKSWGNFNTVIIWDKQFIVNYILPLFKDEKERRIIEYTLANSNDSTFTSKNIINYDNKEVINDKMYFYPLTIKHAVSITVPDIQYFQTLCPKSSWLYHEKDCFDESPPMWINLLIPLLDGER